MASLEVVSASELLSLEMNSLLLTLALGGGATDLDFLDLEALLPGDLLVINFS